MMTFNLDSNQSRKTRLSLVMWALLNNNMISSSMYLVMMIIDMIIQFLMILSLYETAHASPITGAQIQNIYEYKGQGFYYTLIPQLIVFIYLTLITSILLFLILKNIKIKYETEKNLPLKFLSFSFGFLRSFPMTLCILTIANSIHALREEVFDSTKPLIIALTGVSIILLLMYVYFSSIFFNFVIPGTQVPWSEISQVPTAIEALAKTLIITAFIVRKISLTAQMLLISMALLAVLYKLGYRFKRSFIFDKYILFASYTIDIFLAHFSIFQLLSLFYQDRHFLVFVAITYPVSALSCYLLIKKYRINMFIGSIDTVKNQTEKLIAYLQVLELYIKNDNEANYILFQAMTSHILDCDSYYNCIESHMIDQYNKNIGNNQMEEANPEQEVDQENFDDENKNEELGFLSQQYNGKESSSFYKNNQSTSMQSSKRLMLGGQSINRSKKNVLVKMIDNSMNSSVMLERKGLKQKSMQQRHSFKAQQSELQQLEKDNKNYDQGENKVLKIKKNKIEKEKQIKSLVKHLFKHHLISDNTRDFRIELLKVYYTLRILKNQYLAHFQLLEFERKSKKNNFVLKNKKLLNQQFIFNMIVSRHQQSETYSRINLQNILEINQLQQNFESQLEMVSTNILGFWQSLIKQRDVYHTYENGLEISQGVMKIRDLYKSIESKQSDKKETKFYLQMAAFNKFVLFKNSDFAEEMQKSRMAIYNKKLENEKSDSNREKGIIITQFSYKHLMEIEFINKIGLQIINYDRDTAIGMKVNAIMPQIISDNHLKFMAKFMQTGKTKMISSITKNYLKQRKGYVVPCSTYVFVNFSNRQKLIFMFEHDTSFVPQSLINEEQQNLNFGTILCDRHLQIHEITKQTTQMAGITLTMIKDIENDTQRKVHLDDLFQIINPLNIEFDISQCNEDIELEVKPKYFTRMRDNEEIKEDIVNNTNGKLKFESFFDESSKKQQLNPLLASYDKVDENNVFFLLRMTKQNFGFGIVDLITVTITQPFSQEYSQNYFMFPQMNIKQTFNSDYIQDQSNSQNAMQDKQKSLQLINLQSQIEHMSENSDDLKQSTHTSSSLTSVMQNFSQYSGNLNENKIPKTLKFVLQLVVGVIFLMCVTSIVSLTLTIDNLNQAKWSFTVTNQTLQRLNDLTSIRLMFRHIVSIANGYSPNQDSFFDNKFHYYSEVLRTSLDELLLKQKLLQSYKTGFESFQKVQMVLINTNGSTYEQEMYLSQAIQQYATYCYDLLDYSNDYGMYSLRSSAIFVKIETTEQQKTSENEKKMFYVLENANYLFYEKFRTNSWEFLESQNNQITQKVQYSSSMSWICMCIILLCGVVIVPLMMRIQNRILQLMNLFFTIDNKAQENMIKKIIYFKNIFEQRKKGLRIDQLHQETQSVHYQKEQEKNIKQPYNNLQEESKEEKGTNKNILPEMVLLQSVTSKRKHKKHNRKDKKDKYGDQSMSFEQMMNERKDIDNSGIEEGEEEDDESPKKSQIEQKMIQESVQEKFAKGQILQTFRGYIKRKKIIQSVGVLGITVFLSSYFLATYFMSNYSFTQMSDAMKVMNIGYGRRSDSVSAIYAIYETYVWNRTQYANKGTQELMEYYINNGLEKESDYQQQLIKAKPPYLNLMSSFIDGIETSQLCSIVYNTKALQEAREYGMKQNNFEICNTYANNISQNGLQSIYYQIYQVTQQLKIMYQDYIKSKTATNENLVNAISGKLANLIDIEFLITTDPQVTFNVKFSNSLSSFFNDQKVYFVVIFTAFLAIQIVIVLVFLLKLFPKMKKDMLLSNKLLYIIDFEQLPEEQRNAITKFLTNN